MRLRLLIVLLAVVLCVSSAEATTYYIAAGTTGNNANPGTRAQPWRTFAYAVSQLFPGDTLMLLDGTYTKSPNGLFYADCAVSGQGRHGTNDVTRVTIKAENERKAHLQGDGSNHTVYVRNCRYWTVEGLYISTADNSTVKPLTGACSIGSGFRIYDGEFVHVRRNLVFRNNKYCNTHGIQARGHNLLVEENEVYSIHRHSISVDGSNHIVRRNYVNSRVQADIGGGYPSTPPTTGDDGVACYPCMTTTFENNVIENLKTGLALVCQSEWIKNIFTDCHDNRAYGNIVNNTTWGYMLYTRGGARADMVDGAVFTNNVAMNTSIGFELRSNKSATISHGTALDQSGDGVNLHVEEANPGDGGPYAATLTDMLVVGANGHGFDITEYQTWSVNRALVFDNTQGYLPGLGDSHYSNVSQVITNPVGTCKVAIPAGSPAKGAGAGGSDLGANVIYRYENGVLQDGQSGRPGPTTLWDPTTSAFPCGAQVAGVNNIAGSSCFDMHQRLNVNTNGCTIALAPPPTGPQTYYIDDAGGSDSDDGLSPANAWATFAHAVDVLQPGDTLIVQDGTYTGSNMLHADCAGTASDGTADAPVTIRAATTRGARITSNGTLDPIRLENCSYWTVDGLVASHSDAGVLTAGQSGSTLFTDTSDHLTLANLLLITPRRSLSAQGIDLNGTSFTTIRDTEVVDFHRYGIKLWGSDTQSATDNRLRRLHIHSRGRDDAGFATDDTTRGDYGIRCYSCRNTIIENVLVEDVAKGIVVEVVRAVNDVQILDSAVRGAAEGVVVTTTTSSTAETGVNQMPQNVTLRNVAVSGATTNGFRFVSPKNAVCQQCSALAGTGTGVVAAVNPTWPGDGAPSLSLVMPMLTAMVAGGYSIDTTTYTTWSMTRPWVYDTGSNTPAISHANITDPLTTNPILSNCLAIIPTSSPAHTAGVSGDHIGAHLWYQLENGTQTQTALWNPGFPCGATVSGLNDNTGGSLDGSCGQAHLRLNINTGGCSLGGPPPPPGPPVLHGARRWRAMPLLAMPW